jgi:hypothetical protein
MGIERGKFGGTNYGSRSLPVCGMDHAVKPCRTHAAAIRAVEIGGPEIGRRAMALSFDEERPTK